jgi:hypothetical protein
MNDDVVTNIMGTIFIVSVILLASFLGYWGQATEYQMRVERGHYEQVNK